MPSIKHYRYSVSHAWGSWDRVWSQTSIRLVDVKGYGVSSKLVPQIALHHSSSFLVLFSLDNVAKAQFGANLEDRRVPMAIMVMGSRDYINKCYFANLIG